MTVARLRREMSWREFTGWLAFDALEPFGEPRADLRAGIVAATVANSRPFRAKHSSSAKPEDFIPQFHRRALSPEQVARQIQAAFGAPDACVRLV